MSPALAGGFLSTVAPGKYHLYVNISDILFIEKCFPKKKIISEKSGIFQRIILMSGLVEDN